MSEHDNDGIQDAVDAALRWQFGPPNLDRLNDRITAAAKTTASVPADRENGPADPSVFAEPQPLHLQPAANHTPAANRASGHAVPVAVAVAAAMLLMLAWPGSGAPPPQAPIREHQAAVVAPTPPPGPPTSHQVAGRQLYDFLHSADYPPRSPDDCSPDDLGPYSSGTSDDAPVWVDAQNKRLVWECGGETGIDCADHNLPAKRLLIVRLLETATDVIICIEPPGVDPRPELPGDSGYNIFRRTLAGYVLYEVSPLGFPLALPHITI